MSDLIDRQAAIDAHCELCGDRWRCDGNDICPDREVFRLLPSVQPEIIRCKDCKHKHLENMVWTCPFGLPGGENFFCGYGAEPYKGEQE